MPAGIILLATQRAIESGPSGLGVLEQNGHTCFAQFADIPPGSDFVREMNEGLRRSRQVIAVLSQEYLMSSFARSELNTALGSDPTGRRSRLSFEVGRYDRRRKSEGRVQQQLHGPGRCWDDAAELSRRLAKMNA
jgi:hypothetical protein